MILKGFQEEEREIKKRKGYSKDSKKKKERFIKRKGY